MIGTYKSPIMGLGEVALVAAIVFHAFNGLRIILVDFWAWATRHQRQLFWVRDRPLGRHDAGFAPRHLMNVFSHWRRPLDMTAIDAPRSPARPARRRGVELGEVGLDLHARLRRACSSC